MLMKNYISRKWTKNPLKSKQCAIFINYAWRSSCQLVSENLCARVWFHSILPKQDPFVEPAQPLLRCPLSKALRPILFFFLSKCSLSKAKQSSIRQLIYMYTSRLSNVSKNVPKHKHSFCAVTITTHRVTARTDQTMVSEIRQQRAFTGDDM